MLYALDCAQFSAAADGGGSGAGAPGIMHSSYEERETGMLILMFAQLMETLVRYGPDGANPVPWGCLNY